MTIRLLPREPNPENGPAETDAERRARENAAAIANRTREEILRMTAEELACRVSAEFAPTNFMRQVWLHHAAECAKIVKMLGG